VKEQTNLAQEPDAGARLLELADGLMDRAATLAAQSDQLIAVLDDVGRRLIDSGAAQGNGNGKTPQISHGASLLVTQMVLAGSTNDEIATRLEDDLGVENASAVLQQLGL
jgi:hypothetical protein